MRGSALTSRPGKAQATCSTGAAASVGESASLDVEVDATSAPFRQVRARKANRKWAGGGLAPQGMEAPDNAKAMITGPRFFGKKWMAAAAPVTKKAAQYRRRIPSKRPCPKGSACLFPVVGDWASHLGPRAAYHLY